MCYYLWAIKYQRKIKNVAVQQKKINKLYDAAIRQVI
jgi:hypothetical protein